MFHVEHYPHIMPPIEYSFRQEKDADKDWRGSDVPRGTSLSPERYLFLEFPPFSSFRRHHKPNPASNSSRQLKNMDFGCFIHRIHSRPQQITVEAHLSLRYSQSRRIACHSLPVPVGFTGCGKTGSRCWLAHEYLCKDLEVPTSPSASLVARRLFQ